MVNRAQNSGKGFESLPLLPIASVSFRFLKSLDLKPLDMGLNAVPSSFGRELVEWKPLVHQFGVEIGAKPAEVFGEAHDVVEVGDDTSEEGKIDLNLGTEAEPVHEFEGSVLRQSQYLRITQAIRSKRWGKST